MSWMTRVQFLPEAGIFSLHHCIQIGSGAHPPYYPVVTVGSFPGSIAAMA